MSLSYDGKANAGNARANPMDSDGDFCRARNQREEQFQQCGVKKTNLLTSILLGASRCEKKTGNVDFKNGA